MVRDYLLHSCPVRLIIIEVAGKHGLKIQDIIDEGRSRRLVHPRQEAMWVAFKRSTKCLAELSRAFRRDRKTVWHGIQAHERRMKEGTGNGA